MLRCIEMVRFALRYAGHREGASLGYFTGAAVTQQPGDLCEIGREGVLLGRSASAALRLASSQVARAHAMLTGTDEGIMVEDLRSTNGTAVDGVRCARALAPAGSRITFAGAFDFDVVTLDP